MRTATPHKRLTVRRIYALTVLTNESVPYLDDPLCCVQKNASIVIVGTLSTLTRIKCIQNALSQALCRGFVKGFVYVFIHMKKKTNESFTSHFNVIMLFGDFEFRTIRIEKPFLQYIIVIITTYKSFTP